ncbi:MAG TPA: hypothetical protein ENK56_10395 [Chloroflexi bacterium]|nr:hypothetical protein [Chloroflexota bacterium]
MEEYTPESYETIETSAPSAKKSNTGLIIAIIVVVLLLCCCCIVLLALGWSYGDQIIEALEQMGRVMPSLLVG